MKKLLSLIISSAIIVSMLMCAVPAFAFEGLETEDTLFSMVPSVVTEGYSGSTYLSSQTALTQTDNQDGSFTITSSDGTGQAHIIIDSPLTKEDLANATYDYIEFRFFVSYSGNVSGSNYSVLVNQINKSTSLGEYGLVWSSGDAYKGGTGSFGQTGTKVDEILVRINTKTGALNGYVDGKDLTNLTDKTISLENGIGRVRLKWTGLANSSITVHNLSVNTSSASYYDHEVLMSGIENFDGAVVNGVSFADSGATTVTKADDGKVTISGLKSAYTRLMFVNATPIVNGTTFPNGGKIYYEQTVSFTSIPEKFSLAFKGSSDRYESARQTLMTSTDYGSGNVPCWYVGEGDRFQYIQITPNTPYKIGVLYDLETGEYQAYVNGKGANQCKGIWSPDGDSYKDLKWVWLEVKLPSDADTITVSDLFVMREEPSNYNIETGEYDTNEDVLFEGISHVPGCYKWTKGNFVFNALGTCTLSKEDFCKIKATASEKDKYVRMKFDNVVNEEVYPEGIAVWEWDFEIESENATMAHQLEFNNGGKGIGISGIMLLPGKHKAEFIYNPKTGQYRYYIDGAPSQVYTTDKDAGISTLYLEWKGNGEGDALVLEGVKFSNITSFEEVALSYGDVTISEENVASFPVTAPKYSFVNPEEMRFIISAYTNEGSRVTAINCESKPIYSGENVVTLKLDDLNGGTEVKAFLWNDVAPIAFGVK